MSAISGLKEALEDIIVSGGAPPGTDTPTDIGTDAGSSGSQIPYARIDHRHHVPAASATVAGVVKLAEGGAMPWLPGAIPISSLQGALADEIQNRIDGDASLRSEKVNRSGDDRITGKLRVGSLRVDSEAGTGIRLVAAQADGTQEAVAALHVVPEASEQLLRFDAAAVHADGSVATITHPTTAGSYRVLCAASGLFALSNDGRYAWRSTDGGYTWESYDFGSTCMTNAPRGAVTQKDGVESLLWVSGSQTAGCWTTTAWPPVRTTFTSPIVVTDAVMAGADGEPLLIGQDGGNLPRFARWKSGAWEKVNLPTTNSGGVGTGLKTAAGVYVASCWEYYSQTQWIRTSTDFVNWSGQIDLQSRSSIGAAVISNLASGRILRVIQDNGSAAHVAKVSDDNGATWTTVTYPAVTSRGWASPSSVDASGRRVFTYDTGLVMASADNGLTWAALHDFGADVGAFRGSVTYLTAAQRLDIGPSMGLRMIDHAGTTQRMLAADADGDHAPVAAVVWTGTWLQIGGADVAAVASNGLVARTAAGTFAARTLTAPAAGLTISNPAGTAGDPTFALANDLAALEGLSTTGMVARTADGAAATRSVAVTAGHLTVANGSGVAGDPTLGLPAVGPGAGSVGAADQTVSLTTDAQGRVTARSAQAIAIAESQVTGLVADLAAKQPLDADLTAIAALTTTSFGRGFLTVADAAGGLTYIGAVPTTRTVTAGTGLTGGGALSANITLAVSYGATAGTACQGNDARLSDSRAPTAHALDGVLHTITGKTAGQALIATSATTFAFTTISGDATLGATGALTLAGIITAAGPIGAANTVPVITYDAKGRLTAVTTATITPAAIGAQPVDADLTAIAALSGTSGLLKKTAADTWALDTSTYVLTSDARLSDARTPTAHAHVISDSTGLQAALDGKQPLDADLTAIAALTGTGAWLKRTAADTWALTTPTAAEVGAAPSSHVGAGGGAHADATTGASGFMTAADKVKLDGIAASANNYSLPTASASVLGGVKVGSGLSVDAGGTLTATAQSGGINYIANGDAEVSASGWAIYADAAGTIPVDGTGGTPPAGFSFLRDTSIPIRGVGSFYLTKSGGCQGCGASYDFTLDLADIGHVMTVSLDMMPGSGAYVANGVSLWVYAVGPGVLCPVSGANVIADSQSKALSFQFAARTDTQSYRLIIHVATADAGTFGLRFDNIRVSPNVVLNAPAMTDWQDGGATTIGATTTAPTKGTIVRDRVWWRRVGDSAEIRVEYEQSSAGSAGSGDYLLTLPAGLAIDTAKCQTDAAAPVTLARTTLGTFNVNNATAYNGISGLVQAYDSTRIRFYGVNTNASTANGDRWSASTTGRTLAESSFRFSAEFRVPIAGWSGTTAVQPGSRYRWAERYAATVTRVTTTPAAPGQYRAYTRSGGSWTWTDAAPSVAPSAADGIRLYQGNAFSAADTANNTTRYDIYIGPGKAVTVQAFASAGRSGSLDITPAGSGTGSSWGYSSAYNATTGILSLWPAYLSGSETARYCGNANGAGGVTSGYFDILVADDPVPVALAPAVHVEASSDAGQVVTANTTNLQYEDIAYGGAYWNGTQFTAPCAGVYLIRAGMGNNPAQADANLYVNGVVHTVSANSSGSPYWSVLVTSIRLSAGDTLTVRSSQGYTRIASAPHNRLTITRIGDA